LLTLSALNWISASIPFERNRCQIRPKTNLYLPKKRVAPFLFYKFYKFRVKLPFTFIAL
jgi:hypothetical protein